MEATELLKKVRKIEIKTRGLSQNIFAGEYHTAFKGRGMTFAEVREYQYGDDVRDIDWNVTARHNHPYVKVYEEERELTVMLLVDVSGSRLFGAVGEDKREMIAEVAATIAFSAIQNNDKIGVIFFTDKVEKFIPPKKGRKHILFIIRELLDFKPENKGTDIGVALRYFTDALKNAPPHSLFPTLSTARTITPQCLWRQTSMTLQESRFTTSVTPRYRTSVCFVSRILKQAESAGLTPPWRLPAKRLENGGTSVSSL